MTQHDAAKTLTIDTMKQAAVGAAFAQQLIFAAQSMLADVANLCSTAAQELDDDNFREGETLAGKLDERAYDLFDACGTLQSLIMEDLPFDAAATKRIKASDKAIVALSVEARKLVDAQISLLNEFGKATNDLAIANAKLARIASGKGSKK